MFLNDTTQEKRDLGKVQTVEIHHEGRASPQTHFFVSNSLLDGDGCVVNYFVTQRLVMRKVLNVERLDV